MTSKNYRPYQGFENVNRNKSPYEQILDGMYNEMKNRLNDEDIKNSSTIADRVALALKNFDSGQKWDHKPKIKQIASSFWNKKERSPVDRNKSATFYSGR